MPIQVLPLQLANQIAAGEVVERPASVVKELVENSLDAGATRIQIDIENGGSRLIRIRDNGIGIPKQELNLALARHATSKITCLEDLDGILSLGFRGEALASISSVSRLTLTSRTAEQTEAWQVYAQGRDMETTIKPASHPVGTTVEVANLFFNTPARRKFLRADKTEFTHIDEVIHRIALAKFNIAFTLTHNGKIIRQYKPAPDPSLHLKRVASICGEDFVQHALHIDWKHNDLHLYGWIATTNFTRPQNDLSYCYINGRMIRDKVITHAIRQAYADNINTEQYPAFVLFFDLNPKDVDVNVHPTKHEVRFHQQRLIHDFIYQGVSNALQTEIKPSLSMQNSDKPKIEVEKFKVNEPTPTWNDGRNIHTNRTAAGTNIFNRTSEKQVSSAWSSSSFKQTKTESIPKEFTQTYGELLSSLPPREDKAQITIEPTVQLSAASNLLRALALVENKALLLQRENTFYLLSLNKLQRLHIQLSLQHTSQRQPLLIPLVIRLNEQQIQYWKEQQDFFQQYGFEFNQHLAQSRITLNKVPTLVRQQNLQKCILTLLSQNIDDTSQFLSILLQQLELAPIETLSDAVNILTQIEQHSQQYCIETLLTPINWRQYLDKI